MKYKTDNFEHWKRIVAPNSYYSFGTISPLSCIKGPYLAYAWAGLGSVSGTVTPLGTVIGCRIDDKDPLPVNLDYWKLFCVGTLQLVEVKDVANKSEIPEHWTSGVPAIFQNAPQEIRELILDSQ